MKTSLLNNVSLASKTTFRIGGPARFFAMPSGIDEIQECLAWARQSGEPVFILGKGSNVLISDDGWPGLVIDTGAAFDAITWEDDRAVCLSGAALGRLVREMIDRKLRGLEYLAGIPGSVGGALIMNAGAYGHVVTECVESVDYYDFATEIIATLSVERLEAGYRRTVFSDKRAFVISGRFCFVADPAAEAGEIVRQCGAKRKEKHPLDLPNCGSVFKNLPGSVSAGSIIEACDLKGYRRGTAEVSRKHANFIVNLGGATAADVAGLIDDVRKIVFDKKGIMLEPEVVMVGKINESSR